MKAKHRARADGSDGSGWQKALVPPVPRLDQIEDIAASDVPSAVAAWWISHQVAEHAFSVIARNDSRTGERLPVGLTAILRDLRGATAKGCRPFPHDKLFEAAEFTARSVKHLLGHHRHRIVRSHAQLPFQKLREVDTRAMAWLARQPGRNVREKLSGRTHALGVKRELSADTTENRLL
ncbi:MAG: DUF2357 domain-containing protein, partial [Polyangiaceae bacterium]|nr:DUF2357 domain-containing protein [Polyangiaceae bacterium]